MADLSPTLATNASALDGTERIPCTQGGADRALTPAQIKTYASPDATTTVKGLVELATDGETAANVAVQGNDARLSDARAPTAHNHNGDTLATLAQLTATAIRVGDGATATPGLAFSDDLDCGLIGGAADVWYLIANGSGTWTLIEIDGTGSQGRIRVYNSDNTGMLEIGNGGNQPVIQFGISGTTDGYAFKGDEDTMFRRAGANSAAMRAGGVDLAVVTQGISGVSDGLNTYRRVEANTAGSGSPNLLLSGESHALLTNEGATAENYHTLPTAAAGLEFLFYCQDTDGIRIVANAGDTIRNGATVSAAAGFIRCATVGNCIRLIAINATEWIVASIIGAWTIDV